LDAGEKMLDRKRRIGYINHDLLFMALNSYFGRIPERFQRKGEAKGKGGWRCK
jgi:hypothetical protein